jgi:cytosine/adenosine deaminase-related metal-dependent hydrolase
MLPPAYALKARYVFPIDGPPVADGIVQVEHDQICTVGTDRLHGELFDLGNVAILPGFVNAHAHLEFSDLRKPLGHQGMSLADWIPLVLKYRASADRPPPALRISRGIEESIKCGTTTIGEIASQPYSSIDVTTDRVELTVFLELIGRDAQRVEDCLQIAAAHLRAESPWQSGLSPHAPYTINARLLTEAVRMTTTAGAPLAIHLAESPAELSWCADGTGQLAEMLTQHGGEMSAPSDFKSPLEVIQHLRIAPCVVLVHGNYLDDACITEIANHAPRMSVVYCPRTHRYFDHDRYPLDKLLAAGVNVALGTDGRSSNPDLSVLSELRFVARHFPNIPALDLLKCATRNGATSLGRESEIGTLSEGKLANFAVVQLPDRQTLDPASLLLDSDMPNVATFLRGGMVYGAIAGLSSS